MIHGVMDEEDISTWVPLRPQLSRARLDSYLKILSKYYRFISLQGAVEMLSSKKPVQPYSIVITFDDGYRNQLTHAWPILRRYKVPATIYLSTGHVENRKPFWFDRLDYAIQLVPLDGREFNVGNKSIYISSTNRDSLRRSYKQLRDAEKALKRNDIEMLKEVEEIALEFEGESGKRLMDIFEDDNWSALLTWDQAKNAAIEGICFGSHTVDHIRLPMVDNDMARDQLKRSKEMIEVNTGMPCNHLCYPNGNNSTYIIDIARECGYMSAVTGIEGTNSVGADLMDLKRIGVPLNVSNAELLAVVSGLSIAISKIKKKCGSMINYFLVISSLSRFLNPTKKGIIG